MELDDATTLSEYLANQHAAHKIRYAPNYGYVVRVADGDMTEEIRADIKHLAGQEPIHGVEYR